MRDDSYSDPSIIELQERAFDTTVAVDQFAAPAGVLDITSGGTGASSASGARSNFGLGGLAVLNPGVAVVNSAVVAAVAYSQADFQAVIDKLNETLNSIRGGGIIAP